MGRRDEITPVRYTLYTIFLQSANFKKLNNVKIQRCLLSLYDTINHLFLPQPHPGSWPYWGTSAPFIRPPFNPLPPPLPLRFPYLALKSTLTAPLRSRIFKIGLNIRSPLTSCLAKVRVKTKKKQMWEEKEEKEEEGVHTIQAHKWEH